MIRPSHIALCLLCWLAGSNGVFAGTDVQRNIQVTRFGTADGLSQANVNAVTQDRQGYLWIGTQEGLNRYDGRRMKTFYHQDQNPESLGDDWVWDLLTDNRGRLWIATDSGGLNLYDPDRQSFQSYRHDPADPQTLSSNRIRSLYRDRNGMLWVGTMDAGVNRFDPETGRTERFQHDPDDPTSVPDRVITSIAEDAAGRLWVGSDGGGLARFNPATNSFIRITRSEADGGPSDNQIRTIYRDTGGALWIGTYKGGLNRYDPETERFQVFRSDPNDPESLGTDLIRDILMDHQGTLWLATDDGLAEWQGGNRFNHYRYSRVDPQSLSATPLTTLFQDRSGNLWIGSYAGLNKWNYVSDSFKYYDKRSGHLEADIASAVAVDSQGNRWVGTYGAGIVGIDGSGQVVARYRHDPDDPGSLSDDRVMSLAVGASGTLWAGTRSGGLNELRPGASKFIQHRHDPNRPDSLSNNGVTSIVVGAQGDLWVGTYGGGLNRYQGKGFIRYRHDAADPETLSSDLVVSMLQDRSGRLWIGTEDGGLNRFHFETGRFSRYLPDADDEFSFPSRTAWELAESRDGSLWVGTRSSGLIQWDGADLSAGIEQFRVFTTAEGLISNGVLGVVEDQRGMIWISSNRGLTEFNPVTRSARQFDHRYGLRDDEFLQGVRLRQPDGQLLFGSNQGLLRFNPDALKTNTVPPPIALTASSRGGVIERAFDSDKAVESVRLNYPDYYLAFDFSALDFTSPDKNRYRVKLSGFDSDWFSPGEYPRATYTNLPPGDYRFLVQAANNDGLWNQSGAAIDVEVIPPPWKSRTAYVAYVLLGLAIAAAVVLGNRRKLARAEASKRVLEGQVAERTQELEEQNRMLELLNDKLREASLTDPLTALHNRRFFYEFIETQVAQIDREYTDGSRRTEKCLFFMMIDLDGFKLINDRFGHQAGDLTLQQLANLLTGCCRQSDMVCRWGGDEFIIVGQVEHRHEVDRLAERIRSAVATCRFSVGQGNRARLSASIGITHYPFDPQHPGAVSWRQVSDLADRAAYLAKSSGKNAWVRISGKGHAELQAIPSDEEGVRMLIRDQGFEVITHRGGEPPKG